MSGTILSKALPYTPFSTSLYRRLCHLPQPVLLASGSQQHPDARYDILSAAPLHVLSTWGSSTTVDSADGSQRCSQEDPLDLLQSLLEPLMDSQLDLQGLPFAGGAIGYLAYELLHGDYRLPRRESGRLQMPDMLMAIYQWAVVVDHQAQQSHLLALPSCPPELFQELGELLSQPEAGSERAMPAFRLTRAFAPDIPQQGYLHAFNRIIDYIHAGDCYQTNLAQRFSATFTGDPLQAFETLHEQARAPFSAFMEFNGGAVLSFSPERFLQAREGRVITQPIKGTRPRHPDALEDLKLREALRESHKDRAENLMIVDLLRNDLGRVCNTGSVEVQSLFDIVSFANVHHMVSTISGRIDDHQQLLALLRACFPGGSITGAPKQRAMEIIQELEPFDRSVYCGSIAYLGADGSLDSSICIRTLVCQDQQVHCWGGGGIVADSVGALEYQETLDKISLFLRGLDASLLVEAEPAPTPG